MSCNHLLELEDKETRIICCKCGKKWINGIEKIMNEIKDYRDSVEGEVDTITLDELLQEFSNENPTPLSMNGKRVCFMCNEPTTETKTYDRIVNLIPIPLCKRCQMRLNNV